MNRFRIRSIGSRPDDLIDIARHISKCDSLPWEIANKVWKGINNYPLAQDQKRFLRNQLLNGIDANLWSISNAKIIIYRWPNNELRFWLISSEGHLCEGSEAARFFQYFPFIEQSPEGFLFHLDAVKHAQIPDRLIWMPQNSNYSHFLCDYFAPVIAALDTNPSLLKSARILTIQHWEPWQLELISHLDLGTHQVEAPRAGEILFLQADEVILPVIEQPVLSQHILREWFSRRFTKRSDHLSKADQSKP